MVNYVLSENARIRYVQRVLQPGSTPEYARNFVKARGAEVSKPLYNALAGSVLDPGIKDPKVLSYVTEQYGVNSDLQFRSFENLRFAILQEDGKSVVITLIVGQGVEEYYKKQQERYAHKERN